MEEIANKRQIHIVNFTRKLSLSAVFFLIPLYFLQIGYSGWQIGVVTAVFAFSPILFSFPVGFINDTFSMNAVVRGSLFALALLFFLIGRTTHFLAMTGLFLLLGLASNALDVSVHSLYFKEKTRDSDLNRKFGFFIFWVALGEAVGTLGGGVMAYAVDFGFLFRAYAVFHLAVFLLVRRFGHERPELVSLGDYHQNLFNTKTLLFSILIFVVSLHWGAEGTVYSPFLEEAFGLNRLQIALYISIPLFFMSLACSSVAFIRFDRNLNRRLFLISMTLSGIGHILMIHPDIAVSFSFRVVHEIGDGVMMMLTVLYMSKLFEKKSIGGSAGLMTAIMTAGHMTGALLFSNLGFRFGLGIPFVVSGVLLLLNVVFGIFAFRKVQY